MSKVHDKSYKNWDIETWFHLLYRNIYIFKSYFFYIKLDNKNRKITSM